MQKKDPHELLRLIRALGYSARGLRSAWRYEAAFRQEILIAVVLSPLALWLGQTAAHRALLLLMPWLVLIVELLNSAIEAVVDRIGAERHPLSGQAKDMGSAAVLFSLIATGLVWGLAVWERWW